MAIGFVAAFSETLASTVIAEKAVLPLVDVIRNEDEDVLKGAATWTLAQIGKHSSEHAKAVAVTGISSHALCRSSPVYLFRNSERPRRLGSQREVVRRFQDQMPANLADHCHEADIYATTRSPRAQVCPQLLLISSTPSYVQESRRHVDAVGTGTVVKSP